MREEPLGAYTILVTPMRMAKRNNKSKIMRVLTRCIHDIGDREHHQKERHPSHQNFTGHRGLLVTPLQAATVRSSI